MIRRLLGELAALPGIEVVTLRDPRLPPLGIGGVTTIATGGDFRAAHQEALARVDAAWPIAPETDGALESLAALTLSAGVRLLGSAPEAVRLTACKSATITALAAARVPVVPAFSDADTLPPLPGPWVVKPEEGAGAVGVRIVADRRAAAVALAASCGGLITQPWVPGEARSLSLLCAAGDAVILSVNRQHLDCRSAEVRLAGLTVNIDPAPSVELERIARGVASTIPGLWGYVGVDFLQTEGGAVVLEINPRLTTSYCALPDALGRNVAGLVLKLARTGRLPPVSPRRAGGPVFLSLGTPHD
jgi:predicted ATP-grasp superfamily ATP-dependent carboligase